MDTLAHHMPTLHEPAANTAKPVDAADDFQTRLQQHRGIVLKVAQSYRWDPQDRDDLIQDIVIESWRAFPRYEATRPFSTWLYRIALNVAISALRQDQYRRQHTVAWDVDRHDIADPLTTHPEHAQQLRLLQRFIRQQDPLNRALLLLYLEQHSYRDIAEILGLSETNVATKINRLKQRIRTEL